MKYRKKPVVVEAVQYHDNEKGLNAVLQFVPEDCVDVLPDRLQIKTLEGWMEVTPGDYVIRGLRGEFYPCKADAFAETYEPLEETAAA